MGLQTSSGFTLLFVFLTYVVPIFGGWWADVYVGRYNAIMAGVIICGLAHTIHIVEGSILCLSALHPRPTVVAVGAGIFKPNVSPIILDQIRQKKAYTKQLKFGEKVIVDLDATTTRTMLIFYGFINIGAFFMLATTYAEKYVGYWLSSLLTGVIHLLLLILLLAVRNITYKEPPSGGSELSRAWRITTTAFKENKFQVWPTNFWDAANPITLRSRGITVDWTIDVVNDVARTLGASDVFLFFPILNLNVGGIGSVGANQGVAMITNGAPNDILNNFSALTIIIVIPFLTFTNWDMRDHLQV
ncbi:hypothetical protein N7447_007082 [Penicillium robsamsonii]|uniref:uncharacterized protein n=1 Tax=Penicillium robsamsonii TaxID=1792511 RepID=UPI002547D666|nr:uncharacterized protein N7447_007082 [Penicillium robsamsonii]KAJ5824742.1 hypothetical protein N7447_007082 [Penicillium robsamsonii]